MNAREELARVIHGAPAQVAWDGQQHVIADAILAAGYRKPRTITTAEELDALPVGAVLLMLDEGDVIRRHERRWYATGEQWSTFPNEIALPATVLYEPEPQS